MKLKNLCIILVMALAFGLFQPMMDVSASSIRLSKVKLSLKVGKSTTLKVKKAKKKTTWSIKSGKKVISLSSKKKTSVKVKALKIGTAKVQCKVGNKKLVCKVRVTAKKNTPVPTPVATAVPTAVPTASIIPKVSSTPTIKPTPTPYDYHAYVLKEYNTPSPVSDGDRLKVEVGLHKSYLDPLSHFLPGERAVEEMQFFGTGIWREDIEKMSFSNSKSIPEGVKGTFDLSEKQNGSVMAWYTDVDNDGLIEMTIGQDGGVVANENSSYLLAQIMNREKEDEGGEAFLTGIDNLDTSHVTNMRCMFEHSGDKCGKFDLGNHFDTSSVTDISGMFHDFGYFYMDEIHLGAKFDVHNVQNFTDAFWDTGKGSNLKCYVKDDSTRTCFVRHAEEMRWHIGVLGEWNYNPVSEKDFLVEV